ncbi:MAG: hypothetical protein DRQ88_09610 [Epsilonproteobacteria bacterium]|nr:MAG: hypothetical protein DRQ89_02780 [Campylobacterota bacterium]RLA65185.1 MAG: hypothetical protein DRQ88_09610 [Campylobacterota bacterium]
MEKAQGMLIGLHVGDLLGGLMEGSGPKLPEEFQSDINDFTGSEITALTLCVLRSLIKSDGLDVKNLGKEFVTFFDSGPKSLGNTESSAFYSMKIGLDPRECGLVSGGNGSLLRCSPLALFYAKKDLEKASYLQTSLTHTGEVCKICDFLFLMALQMALKGMDKKAILKKTTERAKQLHLLVYDALLKIPDLNWFDLETSCYVLDTFTSAFWALLKTESFEEALISIARKGDDSRACTALTGALCGAYYGISSIPGRWLKEIEVFEDLISQVRKKKLENFLIEDNLK